MGAVFATRKIHDALMQEPPNQIELFHGYTYSGHPAACAAGLAALSIYRKEGLLTAVADIENYWQEAMHSLRGLPHIVDIRNIGLSRESNSRAGQTRQVHAPMRSSRTASTTAFLFG